MSISYSKSTKVVLLVQEGSEEPRLATESDLLEAGWVRAGSAQVAPEAASEEKVAEADASAKKCCGAEEPCKAEGAEEPEFNDVEQELLSALRDAGYGEQAEAALRQAKTFVGELSDKLGGGFENLKGIGGIGFGSFKDFKDFLK